MNVNIAVEKDGEKSEEVAEIKGVRRGCHLSK